VDPQRVSQRRDRAPIIRNLRAHGERADYLVITSSALVDEAVRLVEHKESIGRFNHAKVVEIEDIYREFAGGSRDLTAVRNFLVYVSGHWGAIPDYVVLFGHGHYDFKDHMGSLEDNHIPPPQMETQCVQDYYVCLDSGEVADQIYNEPDASIGRIPAKTVGEARAIVDKIIELEAPGVADWGAWRNRVLLAADDDMQGHEEDNIRPAHYISSEAVADVITGARGFVELLKIYLYEFEWNVVKQKPEANLALVNSINGGVAYANYFGHGAPGLWADEHILKIEDIGSMRNRKRYPVITSFSCSVGRFDIPGHESLSDALVRAPSAGAIAAISSTRLAYAGANEALARAFYSYLFSHAADGGLPPTLGQAFVAAKLDHSTVDQDQQKTYAFLGDPSISFSRLTDSVAVSIQDDEGKPLDTLKALQTVKIKGSVMRNGRVNKSFGSGDSAYVHLALYNPPRDSVRRRDGGADNSVVYPMPGKPLFVGRTRVERGTFEQAVLLPKKVIFKKTGVKLVAYAWEGDHAGGGLVDSLLFDSTAMTDITDAEGPRIVVRSISDVEPDENPGVGYTDRIEGSLPLDIEIGVYDPSGVDVVGTNPDEGLTVEVPPLMSRWNINHKFQFADGDYRKGTAVLSLAEEEFDVGTYTMNLTAQDLVGNVSRLAVEVEVKTDDSFNQGLSLNHVFNYPNPFRVGERTRFFFNQTNSAGDETATIRIYTLSGKLIKVFRNARNGQEWNGTDAFGRRLSPNAYLYRVSVTGRQTGEFTESDIKKVVIHPPR
ncbi:MAG: hypothetical protein GF344_05200, partial [Chitinivibrionales bacterium]|nr:hypothetical protein [Chitinivibrionales bacterium]MBD3356394.1 hypothetical protein [Chitinivibrionales bacterium]